MNEAAGGLNDNDIAAVAHYIATVQPSKKVNCTALRCD
jgi:cytochrome c553